MSFCEIHTVKHFIFARLNFRESGAPSNSRALNFREFETYLNSTGPWLSKGGFRLKIGPFLSE